MNGDIGIGKLIISEAFKDAIHIAVAPVEAGELLLPGKHVGIGANGKVYGSERPCIGIVDPFLKESIYTGQKFYLFLYPGSITSLRHEWVHPSFKAPVNEAPDKTASEAWLREYANQVNPYYEGDKAYQTLMSDLSGNSLTYHGRDMHGRSEVVDESELLYHASIVLGRRVNFDTFEYFSCSC